VVYSACGEALQLDQFRFVRQHDGCCGCGLYIVEIKSVIFTFDHEHPGREEDHTSSRLGT
jgi:hypothetical protein